MKTPQRRFVVEFKSGRRLPKSQASSIWGETDLKALAREVEDQSSHLLGAAKTAVNEVTDPAPDTGASIPASEPMKADAASEAPTNPISVDSPASTPAEQVAELAPTPIEPPTVSKIDEGVELAPTSIEPPTKNRTVKPPKKAPRKRVALVLPLAIPTAENEPQVPPASAIEASTALDDLAMLEAENKRLRQLLVSQLRAQNAELKRMLARF